MGTINTALRELRTAQKSSKGVSLYSRFANRPAGRVLAACAHALRLTPNQVTVISALFSFAAVVGLAIGSPSAGLGILVWLGLAIGFAFDSADGQLARLRGGGGPAGEWLDHVVDCAKITALHVAVLLSFYRHPGAYGIDGEDAWLLLPLVFQFAAVVTFFGGLLTEKLTPRPAPGTPPAAPSTLRAIALLPVDHGIFCLVFLFLGTGSGFRWAYAALGLAAVLFLLAFLVKWFRELAAQGAQRSSAPSGPAG
ncbi:CDP-alcohol phosphatidyltransferase family protein [Streptomyces sp. SPB074]|uniref:CDP-alcohol phosphatidyltransferase family protein n=1 Tax=Streptomyces sp. (strain SPB074) TaxID=465543 RepID=UPI00017F1950|nr:CDP-alcohol phosphatidyltransferase family protein [Streptomyces sp. SPB074]EDY43367.1 CDP-alcohol phosphatidyltransferase superfamily protein [Streptomyces sp. SPB074]